MAKKRVKNSAGLLPFRVTSGRLQVFLVHPGGPFWAKKDEGAWSIAKGEFEGDEDPVRAALREFQEETSFIVAGDLLPLGSLRQPSGKVIHAWAVRADFDPANLKSNTFSMEWPPKSGRQEEFPEIDRAAWFAIEVAKQKILNGQADFLDQLADKLGSSASSGLRTAPNSGGKVPAAQKTLFDDQA